MIYVSAGLVGFEGSGIVSLAEDAWSTLPGTGGLLLDPETPTATAFVAQAGGMAYAEVNHYTARLGVSATTVGDILDPAPGYIGAGAAAQLSETLTFLHPGAGTGPVDVVLNIVFRDDGPRRSDGSPITSVGFRVGDWAQRPTEPAEFRYALRLTEPVTEVYVSADLQAAGTASLDFDLDPLPPGVSFTSVKGNFLRADLYEPEAVIVLTHGWQDADAEQSASRLPELRAALEARLAAEGLRESTVIVEYSWPEAFTRVGLAGYEVARAATAQAGERLALELEALWQDIAGATGRAFEPSLHFIGHSLGTLVNAHAAASLVDAASTRKLGQQVEIDQITILDSPLDPAGPAGSIFEHEDFFVPVLDTPHLRYVENFYAVVPPVFGQQIDGAGPVPVFGASGGLPFYGADHSGVVGAYADLVRGTRTDGNGDDWNAPVLADWRVPVPWQPASAAVEIESFVQVMGAFQGAGGALVDRLSLRLDEGAERATLSLAETGEAPVLSVAYALGASAQAGLYADGSLLWLTPRGGAGEALVRLGDAADAALDWRLVDPGAGDVARLAQTLVARGTDGRGGAGDDILRGGRTGADLRDVIFGGAGDDSIDGGAGNDDLRGMDGKDTIAGGAGADTVIGHAGDDVLTGSAFSDLIFGNDGADFVNGGFGSDRVNGGDGADRFFHAGVAGHGSDWIQDYDAREGDVLLWGGGAAGVAQFQVNIAATAGAGLMAQDEAFVIYRPTGQILWALVDGAGQDDINLRIGGEVFDLLA
jgi:hypothetical protein